MEIAKQTMEKWLKEPYDVERKVKEQEVLSRLRADRDQFVRVETDDHIRSSYRFGEAMREFKSTKEIMIKAITETIVESYKAEVKKVVESDPKIQAMKDEVVAIIKETFPKAVHDAMVKWMASSMQTMFETTMGIRPFAENTEQIQQQIQQRLGMVEAKVGSRGV